jgi:hypothetical protein
VNCNAIMGNVGAHAKTKGTLRIIRLHDDKDIKAYVDECLYNIQCSEVCTLRIEKLHTEA